MASSAGDHFVVALRRMKSEIVAASVLTAAGAVRDLLLKANFDPSQPRVPRGNSEGGRWVRDDQRIGRTSPSNTLWPAKPAVDEPRVWLVADEAEGPPPQVP